MLEKSKEGSAGNRDCMLEGYAKMLEKLAWL